MARSIQSAFVNLTSPYGSRGCLLSCPRTKSKCGALAHKVNKLVMFFPTKMTDLLRDFTYYIMVIV